ncbi:MAG TPA: Lrp/AsnC ligand binding domain-containing protein [Nitrososphaerales archaeon]|nr:Lrp/AsnC ligand binding domain-containing protein [Nitrososphaerales archaeon]
MSNIATTNTLPSYLFATVEKQEHNEVMSKLKGVDYVDWFGSTSGRFDVVASFKGNDMQKTYSAIKKIKSIKGIGSTSCLVPFEGSVDPKKNGERAMAQVFLSVDRPVQDVIQSLKKISGITEALAVSGQWDVLVTLHGQSYEEILQKTVQEISKIDGIRTSETAFVYKQTASA